MPITIDGDGTITGVSVGGLPDGIVDADMLASNAVTTAKISDSQITEAKLASDPQQGIAKAWINFDGTASTIGTGRDSFNVASVTDNGTGDYTVVFTTAMSSANYAVSFGGQGIASSQWWRGLGSGFQNGNGFTASSYRFQTWDITYSVVDTEICTLAFFGD